MPTKFIFPILLLLTLLCASHAQTANHNLAPGAPGRDAQWESAGKDGVGTPNTLESKVWFTLRDGVMTEVYYPTVDVANARLLRFIVVRGKRVETEAEDTAHRFMLNRADADALNFRQTNTAKDGAYTITKNYTVDPELDREGWAKFDIVVPRGDSTLVVAASTLDGSTKFRRVSLRGV